MDHGCRLLRVAEQRSSTGWCSMRRTARVAVAHPNCRRSAPSTRYTTNAAADYAVPGPTSQTAHGCNWALPRKATVFYAFRPSLSRARHASSSPICEPVAIPSIADRDRRRTPNVRERRSARGWCRPTERLQAAGARGRGGWSFSASLDHALAIASSCARIQPRIRTCAPLAATNANSRMEPQKPCPE